MEDYENVILQEIADHLAQMPKIKNTSDIQKASIEAFAYAMGYELLPYSHTFKFKYPVKTEQKFVSYKTMIKLHNAVWIYDEGEGLYYPHSTKIGNDLLSKVFTLGAYEYRKVNAYKIVHNAKLQVTKHKQILTQSNIVEFNGEWLYEQFLGE